MSVSRKTPATFRLHPEILKRMRLVARVLDVRHAALIGHALQLYYEAHRKELPSHVAAEVLKPLDLSAERPEEDQRAASSEVLDAEFGPIPMKK